MEDEFERGPRIKEGTLEVEWNCIFGMVIDKDSGKKRGWKLCGPRKKS